MDIICDNSTCQRQGFHVNEIYLTLRDYDAPIDILFNLRTALCSGV